MANSNSNTSNLGDPTITRTFDLVENGAVQDSRRINAVSDYQPFSDNLKTLRSALNNADPSAASAAIEAFQASARTDLAAAELIGKGYTLRPARVTPESTGKRGRPASKANTSAS